MPIVVSVVGLLVGMWGAWVVRASLASAALDSPRADSEPWVPPGAGISVVFTPEVQHWAPKIIGWANERGLDPDLVATVMQIESCGAPGAVSGSGAQGLFQVMPFHFADDEDMQDPEVNAARGLDYLALGLQRAGGQVGPALAGYNGGHSRIGQDSSLWPGETRRYYYWGTGIYADAASGASESPRLQEWLAAGGASLCSRASQALGLAN